MGGLGCLERVYPSWKSWLNSETGGNCGGTASQLVYYQWLVWILSEAVRSQHQRPHQRLQFQNSNDLEIVWTKDRVGAKRMLICKGKAQIVGRGAQ